MTKFTRKMNKVGFKIKKLRELKDLSQEYMAKELNLSQQSYSRLERGETQINYERLEKIADILKMKLEDITSFDENMVFNNINSQHINNGHIYQMVSNNERKLFEDRIKHLEEEITFLRSIIKQTKG